MTSPVRGKLYCEYCEYRRTEVSNQLTSPVRGKTNGVRYCQTSVLRCFQSIDFPGKGEERILQPAPIIASRSSLRGGSRKEKKIPQSHQPQTPQTLTQQGCEGVNEITGISAIPRPPRKLAPKSGPKNPIAPLKTNSDRPPHPYPRPNDGDPPESHPKQPGPPSESENRHNCNPP